MGQILVLFSLQIRDRWPGSLEVIIPMVDNWLRIKSLLDRRRVRLVVVLRAVHLLEMLVEILLAKWLRPLPPVIALAVAAA